MQRLLNPPTHGSRNASCSGISFRTWTPWDPPRPAGGTSAPVGNAVRHKGTRVGRHADVPPDPGRMSHRNVRVAVVMCGDGGVRAMHAERGGSRRLPPRHSLPFVRSGLCSPNRPGRSDRANWRRRGSPGRPGGGSTAGRASGCGNRGRSPKGPGSPATRSGRRRSPSLPARRTC